MSYSNHIAWLAGILVLVTLIIGATSLSKEDTKGPHLNVTKKGGRGRAGKLLSVFQIVTFPNDPCIGGTKNGTCYTQAECSARGGNNAGTCAGGFGVCCTITVNCGGVSSENCTYFDSNAVTAGGCTAKVCPCGNNICQMRLDFNTFNIAGPSTNTNSVTKVKKMAGVIVESADAPVTDATQCLTDTFSVTNGGGGINPPSICGTNSGEHMYIDVCHDQCTKLAFALGNTAYFTNIPQRTWSIKVTQYSCEYSNLAPRGCTQYYFDNVMDNVQSFNYNNGNGRQLAQQDQSICVRRERGNCRICWYAVQPTDFQTAGTSGMTMQAFNKGKLCGSYFSSSSKGFDFVNIPGAEKGTGTMIGKQIGSNICGQNNGIITTLQATSMTTKNKSVCSNKQPFVLHFRSDAFEMLLEAKAMNAGFTLGYTQDSINCP